MKRLIVKYKELPLGELTYNNGMFCYSIFKENVEKAYDNGYPIMLYGVDKDFMEFALPLSLDNMVPDEGTSLYVSAGIVSSDNTFEKLLKVASLPLYDEGLYVAVVEE